MVDILPLAPVASASEAAGFPDPALGTRRIARVAYLTNVYPKTSHSFIRTEIAALERQGFEVARFTIRRCAEPLVDPDDVAEAARTTALLNGRPGSPLAGMLRQVVRRPLRAAAALGTALRDGHRTRGLVRSIAYFVEAAALARHLERRGIRHVHVHFGTNPAAVARLACHMAALTYSVTVHGPDEFDAPVQLALGRTIAGARFVAAVSSFGRGQLMRWSDPADWPKIEVVRCAVSSAFLRSEPRPPPDDSPPRLVCVARLSAQKGVPLLMEAAAALAQEQDFLLTIIGDGEERAAIERGIASHRLDRHVRLLGWQDAATVRREISAARAMILPSFAEGLPVVLMEALALGRPVVATAIAGIPELVDHRDGWLITSGSSEALTDALRAVLRAPLVRLTAMGEVGRRRVAARHDPDANAAKLAALLRPHA